MLGLTRQELPMPPGLVWPRDSREWRTYSRTTKIATMALAFGSFAVRRAADGGEQASLPSSSADVTARPGGFVINANEFGQLGGGGQYEINDPVTLLRRGQIWVPVESSVSELGAVFCRFAAGAGGSALGAIRGDADGGTCAAIPRARFESDGRKNALVSINL